MNYEIEQDYLQKLFNEVATDSEVEIEVDDADDSFDEDNLEEQDHNTDSEQDVEEKFQENEEAVTQRHVRFPCFAGKDGITKWRKHPSANRRVCTRAENYASR